MLRLTSVLYWNSLEWRVCRVMRFNAVTHFATLHICLSYPCFIFYSCFPCFIWSRVRVHVRVCVCCGLLCVTILFISWTLMPTHLGGSIPNKYQLLFILRHDKYICASGVSNSLIMCIVFVYMYVYVFLPSVRESKRFQSFDHT